MMMKNEDGRYPSGYNGWCNKETWTVNLWIMNEPGLYEMARDAARNGPESLEELVWEWVIPEETSLASDLLKSALAWVDWEEITEGLNEE